MRRTRRNLNGCRYMFESVASHLIKAQLVHNAMRKALEQIAHGHYDADKPQQAIMNMKLLAKSALAGAGEPSTDRKAAMRF